MEGKRLKQIVRTVSKIYGFSDPSHGLYRNEEVEDYVSKFLNDGWELREAQIIQRSVDYQDRKDVGVEIMYILYLPESAVPVENVQVLEAVSEEVKPKRGRPPKES